MTTVSGQRNGEATAESGAEAIRAAFVVTVLEASEGAGQRFFFVWKVAAHARIKALQDAVEMAAHGRLSASQRQCMAAVRRRLHEAQTTCEPDSGFIDRLAGFVEWLTGTAV